MFTLFAIWESVNMLPINLFYGGLILFILLPLMIFRFSRYKNSVKLNRNLALGLAVVAGLLWGLGNQLVIAEDDNQATEYVLFVPQDYVLGNGKTVLLPYQFGWRKASVINNGQLPLIYEIVKYGDDDTTAQIIGVFPYAMVKNLPKPIRYLFSEPPSAVRLTFFSSDQRGWIHR
ncbi:hypothetical protein A1D23_11930 [Chelonobacter oris]|nr:hypothetical protein [Chelonobacter oris]